jgi:hypothetical protein
VEQSLETGTLLEPIELNDAELAAVAGGLAPVPTGGFFNFTNSSNSGNVNNSFNNSFNNSINS